MQTTLFQLTETATGFKSCISWPRCVFAFMTKSERVCPDTNEKGRVQSIGCVRDLRLSSQHESKYTQRANLRQLRPFQVSPGISGGDSFELSDNKQLTIYPEGDSCYSTTSNVWHGHATYNEGATRVQRAEQPPFHSKSMPIPDIRRKMPTDTPKIPRMFHLRRQLAVILLLSHGRDP